MTFNTAGIPHALYIFFLYLEGAFDHHVSNIVMIHYFLDLDTSEMFVCVCVGRSPFYVAVGQSKLSTSLSPPSDVGPSLQSWLLSKLIVKSAGVLKTIPKYSVPVKMTRCTTHFGPLGPGKRAKWPVFGHRRIHCTGQVGRICHFNSTAYAEARQLACVILQLKNSQTANLFHLFISCFAQCHLKKCQLPVDKEAATCEHLNGVGCKNPVLYQRDLSRLAFDSLSVERTQKLEDSASTNCIL